MTYHVKHRSASGVLTQMWEYDAKERRVRGAIQSGNVSIEFDIAVCHQLRPRVGAHPIMRLDSHSFRVVPMRFVTKWQRGNEYLESFRCPLSENLAPSMSMLLTNAPDHVVAEIEAL